MDTGKLLKIIKDIQEDENEYSFQSKFQNILNNYTANNRDGVNTEKEEVYNSLSLSTLSSYVNSDYKILKELQINNFFGIDVHEQLRLILSAEAQNVKPELETFINQRQKVLSKIDSIKISLTTFEVMKPRILENDHYEIGFSFPESYSELDNITNVIKDIRNFLASLADAIGEEKQFKITSVNNGCIEIFINATVNLAHHFDIALDYALKIYAAIKACKELKDMSDKFITNIDRKASADKAAEEEKEEKTNQLLDNLINDLKIPQTEKQNVKKKFLTILKHLENGVSAEVRTPSLPEPLAPADDASPEIQQKFQEQRKKYELKKDIDEKNKKIFILQQNNFYGANTNFLNEVNNEEQLETPTE